MEIVIDIIIAAIFIAYVRHLVKTADTAIEDENGNIIRYERYDKKNSKPLKIKNDDTRNY